MTLVSKRSLARLAVAGAVVAAVPFAIAGTANAAPADSWDRLAQCESGGNWAISSGNGYYGGLQFNLGTWRAYGGSGMPNQASRSAQIAVAEKVLAAQGWNAWPACSRKLGLSGSVPKQAAAPAPVKAAKPAPKPAAAPAPKPAPAPVAKPAPAPAPAAVAAAPGATYTVVAGDTLSKIAAAHGTTWEAVFEKNRATVSDANLIFPGQVLAVA
jgi:nucleoid-associated protein YgaU